MAGRRTTSQRVQGGPPGERRRGSAGVPCAGLERASASSWPALIDAYLERAPRRESDAAAFRDSPRRRRGGVGAPVAGGLGRPVADAAAAAAQPGTAEAGGAGPELAARLGAQGQQDKVASYYHQMEQGLLPEAGVSDTVLEALGRIVGYSREALRKAGQMPAAGGALAAGPAPVFARTTPARGGAGAAGSRRAGPASGTRSTGSSVAAEASCPERLIGTHRAALRSGDRRLAERLVRVAAPPPGAARPGRRRTRASVRRGPARWSAAGERAARRLMDRLGGFPR